MKKIDEKAWKAGDCLIQPHPVNGDEFQLIEMVADRQGGPSLVHTGTMESCKEEFIFRADHGVKTLWVPVTLAKPLITMTNHI